MCYSITTLYYVLVYEETTRCASFMNTVHEALLFVNTVHDLLFFAVSHADTCVNKS